MTRGRKKKTHEEYVAEVAVINPNIEVVGTYVGSNTKIKHRCKIDGYEWNVIPSSILRCVGCPRCSGSERYTQDEYVRRVAEVNPNIEVIGEYVNANTPILHKCKVDGYGWHAAPSQILFGKGCPKCAGVAKKTHEEYVDEVAQINSDIEVVGIYDGSMTKILHRCKIDGFEWYAAPNHILRDRGCPRCAGNEKYGHEEYVRRVAEINPDIEVIGTYIGNNNKILHRCKAYGHEWSTSPNIILQGHGCPKCKTSKGEKIISNWLDNHNILYESQKTFDGCINKQHLPFDFYLSEYNICIEYNGKQHYEPIDYFGGKEKLESQILRDNIKKWYCKENNIYLLEIPYFADIYEELEKCMNQLYIRRR